MPLTRSPAERAALVAVLVTVVLALAKTAVWLTTGSLAVLSQTLDSVVDVVALGLVFLGVRFASKPADASHNYGHAKAENLVAFTQTLILAAIAVGVGVEAIRRMSGPAPAVQTPWYAFALLGASALIDIWRVRSLLQAGRAEGSEALKAGALNLAGDIGTAVVTLISLALVRTGFERADALGGAIVAAAVLVAAVRLGKRSVDVLMDRAPENPLNQIATAAGRVPGVAETRRVRVRGSGDRLFADVTVAARRSVSLERAHDIAEEVEREIARSLPGTDVVVHVEPAGSAGLVERVQAAASRTPGVYEIHNVQVHAFGDDAEEKLRVTLHAKVPSGTSLGEAHDISERIERSVVGELGGAVRVDTHIEPLHLTALGRDVTSDRGDLVDEIIAIAEREADVIDCHEVIATQTEDDVAVVLHVTGKGDLPLDDMHDASERIEEAIRSALPEIRSVLIHFEPK
jgi:cation diffusion facilitator family transporter